MACEHCGDTGMIYDKDTARSGICPYCNGTGDYIPIGDESSSRKYFKRRAPLRTGLGGSGHYAGTGISEDAYSEDSGSVNYAGKYGNSAIVDHFGSPYPEDGETSIERVYKGEKLIRVVTYVYRKPPDKKRGEWEILTTESFDQ